MQKVRYQVNGKKGVVLLNVVIILLTIALIGASLVAFLSLVSLSTRTAAEEVKAFYLAEAGISTAVNTLRNKAGVSGNRLYTIGPVDLGEGTYEVTIDPLQSLIISTGKVASTQKTLQLYYSAL